MTEAAPDPEDDGTCDPGDGPETGAADDDTFDEVRQAAGAVVASLKWLVEATERVIEDPSAFAQIVESGRSVVDAFTDGFATQAKPAPDDDQDSTAHGGDSSTES